MAEVRGKSLQLTTKHCIIDQVSIPGLCILLTGEPESHDN